MRLDRVADDIFIFISGLYAQVTCTVLLTGEGVIVVDTMPFPSETRQVVAFIESKVGSHAVRYVINTHHHSDHIYGTHLFEGAEVIAQDNCRQILARVGGANLERAQRDVPALTEVELKLPDITFRKELYLHLGHRHLRLFHTPGHTPDGISVFVMEEKVLIAGDAVMPVPHIVGGNYRELTHTIEEIKELKPAFIVQGHGDVLLRGEIDEELDGNIAYLGNIVKKVGQIVDRHESALKLRDIDIEACGKSRIPLDGLVGKLHLDNLVALFKAFNKERN